MLHSASTTPCSSHHQPLWSCSLVSAFTTGLGSVAAPDLGGALTAVVAAGDAESPPQPITATAPINITLINIEHLLEEKLIRSKFDRRTVWCIRRSAFEDHE